MRLYAGGKTRGSRSPEPHKAELNRCRRLPQLFVRDFEQEIMALIRQTAGQAESGSVRQAEWPHFVFTCHFTWEAGCVVAFRYLNCLCVCVCVRVCVCSRACGCVHVGSACLGGG